MRRLACKFDIDQSECRSSQVNASARKAWPNEGANRPKFSTCVYLQLHLARASKPDVSVVRFLIWCMATFSVSPRLALKHSTYQCRFFCHKRGCNQASSRTLLAGYTGYNKPVDSRHYQADTEPPRHLYKDITRLMICTEKGLLSNRLEMEFRHESRREDNQLTMNELRSKNTLIIH